MKIAYYLNLERKKNLYCRINDGSQRVTFSLNDSVQPEDWDSKKGEVKSSYIHDFALMDFKKYLETKYHELKLAGRANVLDILKEEAMRFTAGAGVEGLSGGMFNYFNRENDLPPYQKFIEAFEKHTGLKKGKYKVQTIDQHLVFHVGEYTYEMETYEGMTLLLKHIIDNRSFDEINPLTSEEAWSQIYDDCGMPSHTFVAEMYRLWNVYWREKQTKSYPSKNKDWEAAKTDSWRDFQIFMYCFDGTDLIELTTSINEMELYPIAVMALLSLCNFEACSEEYCEFEFNSEGGGWETIVVPKEVPDEKDDDHYFYIRNI